MPDAPVTRFTMEMFGGKKSLLITTGRNESTKGNPGYSFAAFRNLANGHPDRRFGHGGLSLLRGDAEGIAGAALTLPTGVLVGGSYLSPPSEGAAPTTKLLLGRIGTRR